MNEKYVPHYKWIKLNKADKDEFKYKFEAKLKYAEDSGDTGLKMILAILVLTSVFIPISIFALKGFNMFEYLVPFGVIALIISMIDPMVHLVYQGVLQYKIDKWLVSKDL